MKIIAIVVARRNSSRIIGKAMKNVGGEPLVERKVKQLKNVSNIDDVIVGTNWDKVAQLCTSLQANVIWRDDYYCNELICTANEMIGDMIGRLKCSSEDVIVWAHPTNPLISSLTYEMAINTFLKKEVEGFDSLISVKSFKEHLWGENRTPLNYDPYKDIHTLAKDLPQYYIQDGGVFIQRYGKFKENSYFFGKNPYLFTIPDNEYCDINYDEDLIYANSIIDTKNRKY